MEHSLDQQHACQRSNACKRRLLEEVTPTWPRIGRDGGYDYVVLKFCYFDQPESACTGRICMVAFVIAFHVFLSAMTSNS